MAPHGVNARRRHSRLETESRREQKIAGREQRQIDTNQINDADHDRSIRHADKAKAKSIDGVKERVKLAERVPNTLEVCQLSKRFPIKNVSGVTTKLVMTAVWSNRSAHMPAMTPIEDNISDPAIP